MMNRSEDDDQIQVAALLASVPAPEVSADFVARVNAGIDEREGWFGLVDFRGWTLRLAPLTAALALIAVLWPGAATSTPASASAVTTVSSFSPGSATDWQQDVSADALLDAALHPAAGAVRAR